MCDDESDLLLARAQARVLAAEAAVADAPGDPDAALELRRATVELAALIEAQGRALRRPQ
jgi:hypothetical protein